MNRKIYLILVLLSASVLAGCNATEADKHAIGMEVVKQAIRSAFSFGTSAALRSIR